ncbi:MAG: di-heme-cytochrome C peroxidase [Bryobacteraceae bacterium]
MKKRKLIIVGAVAALLIVAGTVVVPLLRQVRVVIPAYQAPGEIVYLQQGWNAEERQQFYHTAQGTRLLPYEWFMALEQPCLKLTACEPFAANTYLGRFGFLQGQPDPKLNPDGLPVGFARQERFYDPVTKQTYPVVGLTCAACHTGELHYGKYAVRIEGGPAMIEISEFQKALGIALGLTQKFPFRFGRFADKVLGPGASEEKKQALRARLDRSLETALAELKATDQAKIYVNPAGFARTDALTRIGNQVFAVDMKNDANYAPANAPVRYPQIWDASWFTWVQYNSSIADPLVRNVGEALGVRAAAKLYGDDAARYDSSVDIAGLKKLEDLLSGPAPYQGLTSPKWPAVFPALDTEKVARGAELYKQHCQGCHLPPVEELQKDLASDNPKYWVENGQKRRFLRVSDIPVDHVGTDPHEAMDFINRKADTGDLKLGTVSAAVGLDTVTNAIVDSFFEKMQFTPAQRIEWRGYREPGADPVRAEPIYKARPLNGIWAVATYLHNGSVPNLYLLLSPQSERPDQFWLGSKQFDPASVGYSIEKIDGGYLYDVRREGNSNEGHEFKNGPRGKGVIGPALPPDDRRAIIEYLKSI